MKRRRALGLAAVVALLIAAVVVAWRAGLFAGRRGGVLVLHGNVDIRQVDLGFRVSGRIAEIPFDEGARVDAGTLLARLDAAPLGALFHAAQANLAAAEAELSKRLHGNRRQDIERTRADLSEAEAVLSRAEIDFRRDRNLVQGSAISASAFTASEEAYRAAKARAKAAEEQLSLMLAGSRREDIAASEAQVDQARAQREKAETDIADTVLYAPNQGVILTRAREPGAIVQQGETVLTLTIDRPMRVRAYISEPDLTRISPGMRVEVSTDGNPRVYHGSIGYIAPSAEFTPKTVQTQDLRTSLVYRLRVIVEDPDDGLRQGAPVSVQVPGARPQGEPGGKR